MSIWTSICRKFDRVALHAVWGDDVTKRHGQGRWDQVGPLFRIVDMFAIYKHIFIPHYINFFFPPIYKHIFFLPIYKYIFSSFFVSSCNIQTYFFPPFLYVVALYKHFFFSQYVKPYLEEFINLPKIMDPRCQIFNKIPK